MIRQTSAARLAAGFKARRGPILPLPLLPPIQPTGVNSRLHGATEALRRPRQIPKS